MRVMRRMGIMGLMGLIMLLSGCCSHSDDTPEPTPSPTPGPNVDNGTPITFYGQEIEEQDVSQGVKGTRAETRAATPLSESATQFKVWGYKNMSFEAGVYGSLQEVFPGYIVKWQANSSATSTTNSNGWEYILTDQAEQSIKYWDWSASAYRFFAVTGTAVVDAGGTYDADKVYYTKSDPFTIKIVADAEPVFDGAGHYNSAATATKLNTTPYFTHLWFSTGILPEYIDKQFGQPVKLEFLKPYSRVRFIFKYSFPREGIKLTEKYFKPTTDFDPDVSKHVGIARKGTVTVSYPLTGAATSESYTSTKDPSDPSPLSAFTEDYDLEDDGKVYYETDEGWYLVLPTTSQGSYTLSVEVNGIEKTCSVPAEYMRWLPGYSYTYIFKILEEGGVEIELVQAAVLPWTDLSHEHTVYNW